MNKMYALYVFIFFVSNTNSAYLLNYTDLMRTYYLLCGPEYFCLPPYKTHKWDISPDLSYHTLHVCPECYCDHDCIRRGDCCSDLYFSFPDMKCMNRTIIDGRYEKKRTDQYSALMVTSCPAESSIELREKCVSRNDTKWRLQNIPVIGDVVPLTFFNRHCAECNNVFNYSSWNLDINCSIFTDFNFLSTLDDIINLAFERKCIFQAYRADGEYGERKEENCFDVDGSETLITKCNQTSEWMVYDGNIAYACESFFKGKYRLFKSVFCYICNPSGQDFMTQTITSCNITGQWMTYDEGLELACTHLPTILSTRPFKNIFCYLCNRGNDSSQMFVDIVGKLKEFAIDDTYFHYQYDMDIDGFNLEYLIYKSLKSAMDDTELSTLIHTPFDVSSFRINNGTLVNMRNLLLQNAAIAVIEFAVCDARRTIFPNDYFYITCECDISCFYDPSVLKECCADLALQIPMHCRDILDLSHMSLPRSEKNGFLTIHGCFQETTNKLIKEGCSFPEQNDIYGIIPMNKVDGITYDNFYCLLCNLDSDQLVRKMQGRRSPSNTIINERYTGDSDFIYRYTDRFQRIKDQFTIWNVQIICPKYLDYSHHLTAGDLIYVAKQMKCRIQFKTETTGSRHCSHLRSSYHCSLKPDWTFSDPDVQWACENVITYREWMSWNLSDNLPPTLDLDHEKHYRKRHDVYSNIFCALCKPQETFTEYFVDNCTSNFPNELCFYFPRTYYYYPFKNIDCVVCNGFVPSAENGEGWERELDTYNRIVGRNWFPMLRNLFSISGDDVKEDDTVTGLCKSNQVFDETQGICRNVTCYNGKYLDGKQCIPLLEITMHLRYSMSIDIGYYILQDPESILWFPVSITDLFKEMDAYLSYVNGEYLAKFGGSVEFEGGLGSSRALCMTVLFDINIPISISRGFIEHYLIDFKNHMYGGCNKNITSSNSTIIDTTSSTNKRNKRSSSKGYEFIYSAKVCNALLCPQIELDLDEYNTSSDNSVLILTRDGFDYVPFDEFAATPDGKIRVCLDFLRQIKYLPIQQSASNITIDWQQKYLWIISLISSIISVISLIFSLIIYSLFPGLRTIPGRLLILMMISLIFTLLFLQLNYFMVQVKYGCFVAAIILHFSWLSVFTSMQTSNFHMWRTFATKELRVYTSDRSLLYYHLYIYGVPSCLVILNALLSRLVYSDSFGGYGGSNCFIKNTYLLISLFIAPVALACVLNILMFCVTVHAIRTTPSVGNSQRKRNELAIFSRLASITGLSWLLQIIDSFLPVTHFTFIATVVNSLQGLFIFIAFIVNKRVWNLVVNRFHKKQDDKNITLDSVPGRKEIKTRKSSDIATTLSSVQLSTLDKNQKSITHSNMLSASSVDHTSDNISDEILEVHFNEMLSHEQETSVSSSLSSSLHESHRELSICNKITDIRTTRQQDQFSSSELTHF